MDCGGSSSFSTLIWCTPPCPFSTVLCCETPVTRLSDLWAFACVTNALSRLEEQKLSCLSHKVLVQRTWISTNQWTFSLHSKVSTVSSHDIYYSSFPVTLPTQKLVVLLIIVVGGDCFTSNITVCTMCYVCILFPLVAMVHQWRGFLFLWISLTPGLVGYDCAPPLLPTHPSYHSYLHEHSEGIQYTVYDVGLIVKQESNTGVVSWTFLHK